MSTLVLGGGVRGGELGGRPALWIASFVLVVAVHAAGGVALLSREAPPPSNEAPEAAIMIDLPADLALPAAESVMSVASESAVDVPPTEVTSETAETVTAEEATEAAPDTVPPETAMVTDVPPEPAETPEAIPPETPDMAEPEETPPEAAEAAPAEVPVETPAEVALETPTEVAVLEETVAPPVLPVAKPRPPRRAEPPVRRTAEQRPQRREPERPARAAQSPPPAPAAVAGQRASGAGRPNPDALRRYMAAMRADIMRQRRSVAGAARRRVTATVRFVVAPSGAVSSVQIVGSSGDSAADSAVAAMVQRASPLPAMPAEIGTAPRRFEIPIRFE